MSCKPNGSESFDPCHGSSWGSDLSDFERIVHDYRRSHQQVAEQLLNYYASLSSFEKAAEMIGLAQLPSGKRHPHQRRLQKPVLKEVRTELLNAESELKASSSFAELFEVVDDAIGSIWGVGELMVYDTAHRLGAYFELEPRAVYFHRGTREGATAIGLDPGRKKAEVSEMPEPLRRLEPHELEDCLCIYKDELRRTAG